MLRRRVSHQPTKQLRSLRNYLLYDIDILLDVYRCAHLYDFESTIFWPPPRCVLDLKHLVSDRRTVNSKWTLRWYSMDSPSPAAAAPCVPRSRLTSDRRNGPAVAYCYSLLRVPIQRDCAMFQGCESVKLV